MPGGNDIYIYIAHITWSVSHTTSSMARKAMLAVRAHSTYGYYILPKDYIDIARLCFRTRAIIPSFACLPFGRR